MDQAGERVRDRGAYREPGVARHYRDQRWSGSRHARRTDARERAIVADLLERCGALACVVDVPCGAGRFRDLLVTRSECVIECDASLAMLVEGGAARGRAAVADALALPLQAGVADLSFCFRLFHHLGTNAERSQLLAELARTSRRFVLMSYFDAATLEAWRHRLRRKMRVRHPLARAAFEALAASAGLRVVAHRPLARGIREQVVVLLEKAPLRGGA
ncbi:MAG TPA: methyltransferase domain-containing protein [Planctomycetota bacterium]